MKKRFGIDIDGTVTTPDAIVPFLNQHFGLTLTIKDIKDYDLSILVDISKEDFSKWWLENEPIVYEKSPLAAQAKDTLLDWGKCHELFFISARSRYLLKATEDWFMKHEIPFDHIELLGTHDKVEMVKKYALEIFFEDKHDNAVNIHEECKIPVILFNTPYNQDPVPKGVIRVNNWSEAKDQVELWLSKSNA